MSQRIIRAGDESRGLATLWRWLSGRRREEERGQPAAMTGSTAFTMALVGLVAKMAKADGVAVPVEAEAFERCFAVAASERANVRRLYALASADVLGFDAYAHQIARLLKGDKVALGGVLDCLFHIASADGILHRAEDNFLRTVAGIFGFEPDELAARRRLFVDDPADPYLVLALDPQATVAVIRARYLALVKENHPDGLQARGAPPELVQLATRKLAVINAAYEAIRASRGGGGS